MPTYSYKCIDCAHKFDTFQRITDDPLLSCPICNKESLKKELHGYSIHFKGKGFHTTDYDKKTSK